MSFILFKFCNLFQILTDQDIDPAIVPSKQIPNQDLRYPTEIRGKESHGNYSDNDFVLADKPG